MWSRRSAFWRIAVGAAIVGTIFILVAATGSFPSVGEGLGRWALTAYVPVFVIANPLIGWPVLAGAAGLLFATAAGTPLALAGVTPAALAQMAIARFSAGALAGRRAAA
jgi:hypothetical protein